MCKTDEQRDRRTKIDKLTDALNRLAAAMERKERSPQTQARLPGESESEWLNRITLGEMSR